jgi:hypothetical protein
MALLERITTDNTDNNTIKQVLGMMDQAVGAVPETLRFIANSPGLFQVQTGQISYYQNHPNLGPELLAFIRYTAACWFKNKACIDFNGLMLQKQGMTAEGLAEVVNDPEKAPLEEKEKALLTFVYNGIKDQNSASKEKLEQLHQIGWKNSDILDAVNHGFFMYAPGKMMDLFQMLQ